MILGGTQVRLNDGSDKPISGIEMGESVLSYDRRSAATVGALVTKTIAENHAGRIYTLTVESQTVSCTPDHRWFVRWSERTTVPQVVYLMQKGDWWRVGRCQLFYNIGDGWDFGLGMRSRQEGTESAWILSVHDTDEEAYIHEQTTAYYYGLPQIPFIPYGKTQATQTSVNRVYSAIPDMPHRAQRCLTDKGRLLNYPLYSKKYRQRQGRNTVFITRSVNIVSGLMAVACIRPNTRHGIDWKTVSVSDTEYSGPMHNLEIAKHGKFAASGIICCDGTIIEEDPH